MLFCFVVSGQNTSTDAKVLGRIKRSPPGTVFAPSDFRGLGSSTAVRLALMRHARSGTIRNIARGLYERPRQLARIGALPPSVDQVVQAIQERDQIRLQPSGAHAANLLWLSTQVPVRSVFLTDGRNRKVHVGKQEIVFKNASPRQMATDGRISGTVIQALRWLGQDNITDDVVVNLRRRLSDKDKRQLLQDLRFAPAWVAEIMRRIAEPSAD